jgi:hypothetical protein
VPYPLLSPAPDSAFYGQIAADGEDYAIVDLPLTREDSKTHRYYQTKHHKPIVGGWHHRLSDAGFSFIDSIPLLSAWSGRDPGEIPLIGDLATLAQANVRYIVLHKEQLRSVPAGMTSVFAALRPAYQDDEIYVWRTDVTSTGMHSMAHTFDGHLGLLQPSVTLSTDATPPALSLSTCWLLSGLDQPPVEVEVVASAPHGVPIAQEQRALVVPRQGTACQNWSWPLVPDLASGDVQFHITPLIKGRALGTYRFTQAVHVFQDGKGKGRLILGHAFPVAFDAPIESLGYRMMAAEGAIWLDVYWRSLADHDQAYKLFVQVFDEATGLVVENSDDILHQLEWQDGSVLQSHRVLFLDRAAPGEYELGYGLYLPDDPNNRIPARDGETGRDWAGNLVMLGEHALVLPRALEGVPLSEQQRLAIYTDAPYRPVDARFGDIGTLVGCSLPSEEATTDDTLRLTLYWRAAGAVPTGRDLKVFVHVVGESGQIIAQHDGAPAMGQSPIAAWQEGELIVDVHEAVWQRDDFTGEATIFVGLYDGKTMDRLQVQSVGGESYEGDLVSLGAIHIRSSD